MDYQLIHGDCLEVMVGMEDDSIDAIVTDPPGGIAFMGKEWDKDKGGRDEWIAWMTSIAAECLRVLKPGGHALVWALPRTSHWTATAWENAGFEVRERISHLFGSGFPKSLDIGKAIDKMAGAERKVIGSKVGLPGYRNGEPANHTIYGDGLTNGTLASAITAPATPEALQWDGWGSALKPACEDWWLLRKPLSEKTIATNVLKWGVGGLNINGCRVETSEELGRISPGIKSIDRKKFNQGARPKFYYEEQKSRYINNSGNNGRFPANITHDGSEEVLAGFPVTKSQQSMRGKRNGNIYGNGKGPSGPDTLRGHNDEGSTARFFYCAKASKSDRTENAQVENRHPTVKNSELMRWLCRLITPPGGVVLDPFMGSGSTGKGALLEGFRFVGIELEAESFKTAEQRLELVATMPKQLELATCNQT